MGWENCGPANRPQTIAKRHHRGGVKTTADIQRFARSTGSTRRDHTFVSARWIGIVADDASRESGATMGMMARRAPQLCDLR
jgi:hypothetical protein